MSNEFDESWKRFPIIYVMGGMFFNYYQFTSVACKKFPKENIFIFFTVLVIGDVVVLLTPVVNWWFKATTNLDLRSLVGACAQGVEQGPPPRPTRALQPPSIPHPTPTTTNLTVF